MGEKQEVEVYPSVYWLGPGEILWLEGLSFPYWQSSFYRAFIGLPARHQLPANGRWQTGEANFINWFIRVFGEAGHQRFLL